MITDFTTYADVRAALGVSDEDIEDETLALGLYSDSLQVEMDDIGFTLVETYVATKAVITPSAVQARFMQAVRLFSTFAVAKQLTAALPLFAAKQVGDGKASVQRFDNPYKDTIKQVNEQYDRARRRLVQVFGELGTASSGEVKKIFLAVAAPSIDPVTGFNT